MNILYPVFALFSLTFLVSLRLAALRYAAAKRREVDPEFYKAFIGEEPLRSRITARNLSNLLETPMLFYVGSLVALLTQQTSGLMILLAWSYVASRLIHSLIHLGPNVVLWRFGAFMLSMAILGTFWVLLFIGLVTR